MAFQCSPREKKNLEHKHRSTAIPTTPLNIATVSLIPLKLDARLFFTPPPCENPVPAAAGGELLPESEESLPRFPSADPPPAIMG